MFLKVMQVPSRYPAVLCTTPFGFPVEPEVYRMNRGSSASHHTGSQERSALAISSCHQMSLPGSMGHSAPARLTTMTFSIEVPFSRATSALLFSGTNLLPR
ncbi:MAG: hypothetical protein A4E29_00821 [Methanomassiliicoccales archaeon PtaB.Bin134]|nr:MAG: hypothetical protein A4E29_00821 [Methanomassiliicoccales archaeon PtaB.Bin134]